MNTRAIFKCWLLLANLLIVYSSQAVITTLSRNDPTPPYTTDNPFAFCGTSHYEYLKGREKTDEYKHFVFEVSPFYQRANHGSNSCGCTRELGDINGRWNMIALLPFNYPTNSSTQYSYPLTYTNTNADLPCGKVFPKILIDIRNELLSNLQDIVDPTGPGALPTELKTVQGLLDLQGSHTANDGNLGYYAVGMKYKKQGIRFNTEFYIGEGVGFDCQLGFASIDQCATFTNRTTRQYALGGNPFDPLQRETGHLAAVWTSSWNTAILQAITTDLMARLDAIVSSTQMNYSLCNFHDSSIEDLYGEMFWRYPAQINANESEDEYPKFLFIPFIALGGTYAIAKTQNFSQLLSLPFGNNGHSAARVRGGFSLDFYDSVQLNFETGITKFKSLTYCNMPMPNNNNQHPIYPFRANAHVTPGNNWHILLGFNAHNFWYKWSASFDYIYVSHDRDCITLMDTNYAAADPEGNLTHSLSTCRSNINPLKPEVLQCISKWSAQVINCTLNYGIAPDFSIGGLIQIPVRQKSAYRASTFMLSLFINI